MATVKFATLLEKPTKAKLTAYAKESNQSISGIVNNALELYFQQKMIRSSFRTATEQVIAENRELLTRLAK